MYDNHVETQNVTYSGVIKSNQIKSSLLFQQYRLQTCTVMTSIQLKTHTSYTPSPKMSQFTYTKLNTKLTPLIIYTIYK